MSNVAPGVASNWIGVNRSLKDLDGARILEYPPDLPRKWCAMVEIIDFGDRRSAQQNDNVPQAAADMENVLLNEGLELLASYCSIHDKELRLSIMSLVGTLAQVRARS